MPWVDTDACTGCGTCVDICPVDTIYLKEDVAEIDMARCIRCGQCHDACPEDAVRHDSEKIPEEVAANVAMAMACMDACIRHLGDEKEGKKCLNRLLKHFNKEKTVIEQTLERLEMLRDHQAVH
jgi:ferredoxin